MKYQRKTKDVFFLIWNGEEIDQFDTRKEARAMRTEYNLAFKGGVWMKVKREPINPPPFNRTGRH